MSAGEQPGRLPAGAGGRRRRARIGRPAVGRRRGRAGPRPGDPDGSAPDQGPRPCRRPPGRARRPPPGRPLCRGRDGLRAVARPQGAGRRRPDPGGRARRRRPRPPLALRPGPARPRGGPPSPTPTCGWCTRWGGGPTATPWSATPPPWPEAGVAALNLRETEWSLGLVTLAHRFDLLAFAWDVQEYRRIRAVLEMGVDGIYSDHVERMVAAVGEWPRRDLQKTQVAERPDLHERPAHDRALVDGVEERRVPRVLPVVAQDVDLVRRDLLGREVAGADVGR